MRANFDTDYMTDRDIYGAVPLTTPLPDRTAALTAAGYDPRINPLLSENILADLRGDVSYDPSLQFAANTGLRTGLMGSEFAARTGASDYLNRVQQARQRGQTNALNTLGAISNFNTIAPETEIALGQTNRILEAAPDPAAAGRAAISNYQSALDRASSYFTPTRSSSGGGGYAPLSQDMNFNRTQPMPQAVGGLVTSDDPYGWNPQAYGQAGATGGGGWNNMAFGGGGGGSSAGGMPTPTFSAVDSGGYDIFNDDYYTDVGSYYNPSAFNSGTDWSQFE